jgi:hypothetical protein
MSQEIPYGYCHCGCGQKTNLADRSDSKTQKGEPRKFISTHHYRLKGEQSATWKGGTKTPNKGGYTRVMVREYRSSKDEYVYTHRHEAEKMIGGPLPTGAVVHHCGPVSDNNNITVFSSASEHRIHHEQEIAFAKCGHRAWRKCKYCKTYDDLSNMEQKHQGSSCYHLKCRAEHFRNRRLKIKSDGL